MIDPREDRPPPDRHRIVIVGGGVAGLDLAGALGRADRFDVTLIDAVTAHVWKPMLHSIAAGTHDAGLAGIPYVAQARAHGFAYQPGWARGVDLAARAVEVAAFELHGRQLLPERQVDYDTLVLAAGSVADPFDVEGVAEHARHIDTLEGARAFQAAVVPRLVEAAEADRPLRIAIVGGGATGVQLAAELLRMADIADHFGIDGARGTAEITLLDKGDRLLPPFPATVARAARTRLERLGVTVRTGVDVVAVEADALRLKDGERIATDLTVWAAGVRAAPLVARIEGLEHGQSGRLAVDGQCRTTRDANVFALGDCAVLTPPGADAPLPTTAQVAYQQARYLARHLPALIAGEDAPGFRYRDYGALVALGGYEAYGALGGFGFFRGQFFRGRVAQWGHALLYRRHQWRLLGLRGMLGRWIAERATAGARPVERLGSTRD